MSDAYLQIAGARANTATLRVPYSGRWVFDGNLDGSDVPAGRVTVKIGELELVGTVDPLFSGAFVGHVQVRVVAGAGGWSKAVPARSYHDDGGVRRRTILDALARDTGETIESASDTTRLGVDFERPLEPASRTLLAALRGGDWRVDFDGVTRYGARPSAVLAGDVELLDADVSSHVLTLGASDPSGVPVGTVVTDARLATPIQLRELEWHVESGRMRVLAWGVPS